MAGNLRFSPHYSRQLSLLIWGSHLLALPPILLLPLSVGVQAGIVALVVLSLLHNRHTHLLRSHAFSIVMVEWDGEDEWLLFGPKGSKCQARLLGSSYVQPWLMVLNFKREGKGWKHASLILMPDALDATMGRRLRVRLRLR